MGLVKPKRRPRLTVAMAAAIVADRFKPLGTPGKMPGYSWDIPAKFCQRGAELQKVKGTTCAICYARHSWFCAANVQKTQMARLKQLDHPQWPEAMSRLINAFEEAHFRWFSSGDLQSVEHLASIAEVCENTSEVDHWLPTHEPYLVKEWLEQGGRIPPNLCIRISADYVESAPDTPTWDLPTSTVHRFKGEPVPIVGAPRKASIECRAYAREQGYGRRKSTSCGKCRACWDPRVQNVSYLKH
jgi:hypothetical protein